MNAEIRSALSGAATGCRAMSGFAALALDTPASARTQPDRTLARPAALVPIGLLAGTELVTDKLPNAPSRLAAPGLVTRAMVAAACGVVIARRTAAAARLSVDTAEPERVALSPDDAPSEPAADPRVVAICAATAIGASLGTAWLGVRWRSFAQRRLGPAWLGAVIEDAATVGLAVAGSRYGHAPRHGGRTGPRPDR